MIVPDHSDDILAVLARWYPDDTFTVTPASEGISTPVYRVEANSQVGFVRLGEQPEDRRAGEIAAHRQLAMFDMPVPHILDYEDDPPELDRSIALTSSIAGVPLSESPDLDSIEDIGFAVGTTLACINRTPVSGYGWVIGVADDDMLQAEHPDRATWTADYVAAAEKVGSAGILPPDLACRLRSVITRWAHLPDIRPASLAHGDFDSTHIYADPVTGAFSGIIDFGEIRGADHLYDLGHLLVHDGEAGRPELFSHVLAGYTRLSPQPDNVMMQICSQAIAIATRELAIQIERPASRYRDWLARRIRDLVHESTENG